MGNLLICCGCDAPTLALVQGNVLLEGQPLVVEHGRGLNEGVVIVELIPKGLQEELPTRERAIYDEEDGSFVVPGARGNGIPPGDYKIAVLQLRSLADRQSDLLRGAFSANRTPLSCQVSPGGKNFVEIELSQYLSDSNRSPK